MQAVGRLGSYISKSVYTVSGPFHPFGGAVDIIVVEQPDGSYKSSPWYVRFGKFQGVLKTKEKVVGISVNGVEADFHMYLDHKGEAYFLKEVDVEEGECACSPPSSSGEDTDRQTENRWPLKSKSCNYDANWSDSNANERNRNAVTRTNSRRAQILGLVFGRRSMKEDGNRDEEEVSGVIRRDSLERAEIAADLLELNWSTNLASSRHRKDNGSRFSVNVSKDVANQKLLVDGCTDDEQSLLSHSGHQEMVSTVEENAVEMKCLTPQNVAGTATPIESVGDTFLTDKSGIAKADYQANSVAMISEIVKSNSQIQDTDEKLNSLSHASFSKEENAIDNVQAICDSENSESSEIELEGSIEQTSVSFCNNEFGEVSFYTETVLNMTNSISEVNSEPESDALHGQEHLNIQEYLGKGDQFTIIHEEKISLSGENLYAASDSIAADSYSQMSNCDCIAPYALSSKILEEEKLLFGDLDDFASNGAKHLTFTNVDHEEKEANPSFSSRVADDVNESCHTKCCSSFLLDQSVINDHMNDANLLGRTCRTISSDVCIKTTGHDQPKEIVRMARSLPSRWPLHNNLETPGLGHSLEPSLHSGVKSCANDNHQSTGVPSTAEDVNILKESKEGSAKHSIGSPPVDSLRESQKSWPFSFKRSRSMKVSHPTLDGIENSNALKNTGDLEGGKDVTKVKVNKKKVRTLTPTTEQLKSLNLKEGRNMVIFTFSTAMLGTQQVDARIFLWRWDTQIVISDVDGTITRSDLLGQVMPLVGMDWSQIGVAHLFSAIKENGYQLLFLSARSISQAFHTRQFLFNIKQDGKALPDGPVVISPDGLFPSLFREVVRRAPHEFKIACLEDIKALFPADKNPFYAGFGNRDTDEFSYLKVGIPRGKIFIINPKGEIVVNRRVDTKSYLSLHTLVHGMFPSMSSCEQEDFNSWNYWKLPPPIIDV